MFSTNSTWFGRLLIVLFRVIWVSVCVGALSLDNNSAMNKLVTLSESTWRSAATRHADRIRALLAPGLLERQQQAQSSASNNDNRKKNSGGDSGRRTQFVDDWTGLDPVHPIFNFMIEYYGIKGSKGTRRLARWSPDPALLMEDASGTNQSTNASPSISDSVFETAMKASNGKGGVFLENANLDDLGGRLHLRGAIPVTSEEYPDKLYGILYNPALFYNRFDGPLETKQDQLQLLQKIAPFQWYKSILETTLNSEPILHCHGLHEWAMVFHPPGSPPPPSAKYQASLPLRVSREVINETVERKGIHCTHVDALRFFAPAAAPLNHHGASLERIDQIRLEQKACVHAHMDLFKMALKLQPFINANLMADILELAIRARTLDVAASPYDATAYGAGIVPVETKQGRKQYREIQRALMEDAEPVRVRLLQAYDTFLQLAFDPKLLEQSAVEIDGRKKQGGKLVDRDQITTGFAGKERFAKAEPGGLPWRRNLIDPSTTQ
eukprot:scaffold11584_cov160-Amphora_coffeaeformis.AAC.1